MAMHLTLKTMHLGRASMHGHMLSTTSQAFRCRNARRHAGLLSLGALRGSGSSSQKDLVKGLPKEHQDEAIRALELADRAASNWIPTFTSFLPPPSAMSIKSMVDQLAHVVAHDWGGYPQAERCRIILARDELMDQFKEDPEQSGAVAAVKVEGNFLFDPATHGDFLGAVLGTGIVRGVVGDILVQGDRGATIFTTPDIVSHLENYLVKVRTVSVEARQVPLSDLVLPTPKTKEINTTEASMRLDAVASAGFGVSREKMAGMIKAGDVRVNWVDENRPATSVKDGDVVSCSGKGRIEIKSVGMTKKGRYGLSIIRYV